MPRRRYRDRSVYIPGVGYGVGQRTGGMRFGGFRSGAHVLKYGGAGGRASRLSTAAAYRRARRAGAAGNLRAAGVIGKELKWYDASVGTSLIADDWAGTHTTVIKDPVGGINCLDGMGPGTGPSDYVGSAVYLKSVQVKGVVQAGQITAGNANGLMTPAIRVMLILDRETNGAQFTVSDFMNTELSPIAITASRNLESMGRFQVLDSILISDFPTITETSTTAVDVAGHTHPFELTYKWKTPLKDRRLTAAADGKIGNHTNHSIHVVAITGPQNSQAGARASTNVLDTYISYESRIRFFG